jgi:hypothetical protein
MCARRRLTGTHIAESDWASLQVAAANDRPGASAHPPSLYQLLSCSLQLRQASHFTSWKRSRNEVKWLKSPREVEADSRVIRVASPCCSAAANDERWLALERRVLEC